MLRLLPVLLLATTVLRGPDGVDVPAARVRSAPDVHDPIFAYLVGLIDANLYGTIDESCLEDVLRRTASTSPLPYRHLESMDRAAENHERTARIDLRFDRQLALPIPYRILGYAPGSLRASRNAGFRDWSLGELVFTYRPQAGAAPTEVRLSDVHLFALRSGEMWVDIDAWLDALVGGKLDDTRITGLALFRYGGERWGLAVGYNREWEGRSGLFSMKKDQIVFPSPPPLKTAAWKLRQILEGLEPSLRPDSLRARSER
jgi:hypothetical protein